jgi:hypothetical protein
MASGQIVAREPAGVEMVVVCLAPDMLVRAGETRRCRASPQELNGLRANTGPSVAVMTIEVASA